jgi:hypothetical protein
LTCRRVFARALHPAKETVGMHGIAQLTRYAIREGLSPLDGGMATSRRADSDRQRLLSNCG